MARQDSPRGYPNRRKIVALANKAIAGSHTHFNSLNKTPIPHSEKKPKPMGETRMGLHGKKNLS
jgi:hypothetical protein